MRILVLYDNRAQALLQGGWGFSCLVETGDQRILFDAGADRLVLEHNVRTLGVDLSGLTDVFLSHPHCDHVGGLSYVLERAKGVRLWVPAPMEPAMKKRARAARAELVGVRGPRRLGEGLWSTGTMGRAVKEHGLVVAGAAGPVLVTGCAHPGIDRMARRAARIAGTSLRLALGGFHLEGTSEEQLARVIRGLKETAQSVAPGHCTGKVATAALTAEFPSTSPLSVGTEIAL